MDFLIKFILLTALLFIPALTSAEADRVFRENHKSIVVVTAYNNKGQALTEGTGFVAGEDGVIVTNFHVISIASDVKVKTGPKVMDVEGVIHADKENDLVILKVNTKNLPAVRLGNAEKNKTGDKLYIISSREGVENIISDGIYRGIKEITHKRKVLQVAAPVTHGSSGSPVFNESGEVIGIVTFSIKRTQRILLAMPIDLIRDKIRNRKIIASKSNAIRSYKEAPERWFYLGYFLIEAGAHEDAIGVLKEAVRLRPDFADAYYYLGSAYEKAGKDTKATEAYKKAVLAASDFSDAYFSLGLTYGRLGKYREAANALKETVKLEPDYADAHYNLCLIYLVLKDKASALEEYRILKGLDVNLAEKLFKSF